ncbi:Arylsulfatase precursor [Bremerella volcania]|uniref:Arylsulfatase n=1 Tax=Bremerella volcania TaxID=2527984 RepID=A0A518C9C3_9BACT|nr:sulfatase-like hydrolase/transferase [Bremerella volcania]QDU75828.1 Arylsulfatase precursor [Bremerella volcania]
MRRAKSLAQITTLVTKLAMCVMLTSILLAGIAQGADRPNIILIMADDIGAEGLGCYGSTIYTTPNLDRMANEGVRFNNAYATPLCTPTRVMIMSGLYPNRTGFQALIGKREGVRMPASIRTFGHYFHDAGYQTAIAGKWQLGKFDEFPNQPIEHGFDHYCMWTWLYDGEKTSRYYSPHLYQDGKVIEGAETDFGPDHYSNYLLNFIDQNKDKPFFIYYPMALVHSPFVHPPKLEEPARSKYTDDLDKPTQAYGHMITYMDNIVGKILSKLKEHRLEKNTLVLFTGDNGTDHRITSRLPDMSIRGGKATMTEAGTRVPLLAWWPNTIEPGVRDELFCLVDVLPTITSVAGIKLEGQVDGMDLSHNLTGAAGRDRRHVLINYGKGYFVREQRFRINQDGVLYDIPITSDKERYLEKKTSRGEYGDERDRLQMALDEFMAIEKEYILED